MDRTIEYLLPMNCSGLREREGSATNDIIGGIAAGGHESRLTLSAIGNIDDLTYLGAGVGKPASVLLYKRRMSEIASHPKGIYRRVLSVLLLAVVAIPRVEPP